MTPATREKRAARRRLLRFLKRGGILVREDFQGVVGVQWRRATRSGQGFETATVDRLLEHGCTIAKEAHQLAPVSSTAGSFALIATPPEAAK